MKDKITEIIIGISGYTDLPANTDIDLIENGILDSFGLVSLINTLEDRFDIEIQPTQIDPSVWKSIDRIARTVEELLKK